MSLPLEGIRVIDWTIWQQGPVASTMLADLGAEVIKLEEREGGDPGRGILSMSGIDVSDRPNFYFEANNRNKKSLTLDLKQAEGRQIVHELVASSDVFVQNFRKGVAARLDLDYDSLRKHNPQLIYASATGYGPNGPDSGEPSFDHLALARSGVMLAAGEPGMPPLAISGGVADQMGAIMLAYGVLAALLARERSGVGQQVESSHLGSMMMLQGLSLSSRLMNGAAFPRMERGRAGNPLWNHYRCKDDRWIALAMLQSDRYWPDFARALDHPEWVDDERFSDLRARAANAETVVRELDAVFATRNRDEWLALLKEREGDFIYTVVNSLDDLPDDPQVRANDYIVDFEHPAHGTVQMIGMPVHLSETPGEVRMAAPEFGQHTEEILHDVLGYSWDRIGDLRRREIL